MITNHRQGEDREYAEILNRIRVGDIQESDIEKLNERVVSHQDVPNGALIITCKNKAVNLVKDFQKLTVKNSLMKQLQRHKHRKS